MKLRHDFAGHYNRPDIFHLHINRAAPQLYSVHGVGSALPDVDTMQALPAQPPRLELPEDHDLSVEPRVTPGE
jgi:aliphatic nitrilase